MVNVFFSYENADEYIINNLNLEITKGCFVTLTGSSGSGKSTIAKLMAGQIETKQGDIFINDRDINQLSARERAEVIFHISQNDYVFMDTLRFNLKIACPEATDDQLILALNLARLDNLASDNGTSLLDIKIGDNGMTLSGGQRQRLSLARLFLRNPRIIILDEITSALDVINERGVIANIKRSYPHAMICNISHRSSTFDFSDEIIVIEKGRIVDRGDFVALKRTNTYIQSILRQEAMREAG